jgi:zinc protease
MIMIKTSARWLTTLAAIGAVLLLLGTRGDGLAAQVSDSDVLRATLDNGLRVIIVRNTLAPVVATAVNYLVGSNEAPPGFPGMAHAQEHMMFRGSPDLSADQLASIGSVMGGSFNANTRESLTQYLYTVPSDDLDVALHIEALRMQGVLDTTKDWDEERGAIEQEVAQDLSSPDYVAYERIRAAMFAGSVYAHDALGTRPSFDKTTAQMLKSFHDKWYAPNNAILIVVGDVDPAKALDSIRKLFGAIKSKSLPARPALTLQPVKSQTITSDTDRAAASLTIAMRLPGLDSPDFPALEVLSDVLSSQRFDLYGLVPQGKAIATDFSLDPLPKSGMGLAEAVFSPSEDPKALESDVRAILKNVVEHGVSADLVAAAKLQERRSTEFEKNSIEGLASVWSDAVALYGLTSPDEDLERIDKVTVADVNRVAKQYLDLDHAITVVMLPKRSGEPTSSSQGFGGQENISLGEAKPTALPDWAEAAIAHLSVPPATTHPIVSTLANGLTLIVQPETVSDTVTVYGHIKNRPDVEEPRGKEGISQVLEQLFSYGSTHLDRLAFQSALDQIGAEESAGTDFSIGVLSDHFDRGVELLADNELHPALPDAALAIVRSQFAQLAGARNKTPGFLLSHLLRKALFPKTDPSLNYSTPQSISSITSHDLEAYYHHAFRPDLTTIVVIGNIDPAMAKATIEKYFGSWTASGPKPPTDLPPVAHNPPGQVAVPDASRVQDIAVVAQALGLKRSDPDYYALNLGNAVLGGGFYSSRFSIDLRKKAGLVYAVDSSLEAGKTRSVYLVQYACDPQNVTKASDLIVRDITSMRNTPTSEDELAQVKALLVHQIPLGEASVNDIAREFVARHDLDLPLDEPQIEARRYIDLTPAQVQSAFQKWIRTADFVRATQGPPPQ